jgi:hypothetical protein
MVFFFLADGGRFEGELRNGKKWIDAQIERYGYGFVFLTQKTTAQAVLMKL